MHYRRQLLYAGSRKAAEQAVPDGGDLQTSLASHFTAHIGRCKAVVVLNSDCENIKRWKLRKGMKTIGSTPLTRLRHVLLRAPGLFLEHHVRQMVCILEFPKPVQGLLLRGGRPGQ
jgi:hypothetical protein